GKWNYDGANRNKMKRDDINKVPQPLLFSNDVKDINKRIEKHKIKTIGIGSDQLLWPTSRSQAKELLQFFLDQCLCNFGFFQDSMTHENNKAKSSLWSLYHSRVSFALNAKMISPAYVVNQAIKTYRSHTGISVEQIEGFVRQILGWREFVRGIYWINMPDYKKQNYLNATNALPDYFWTGKTKMNCMHHAISQSLNYAYAHHIQRLMITGNFSLLTGINPDLVDDWYLGIYIDAIEWVELPNTRGMSQFADGGLLASKAYAASGNYVNKMSDYCKSCHYDVKAKVGETACPFNSLYWGFMNKHEEKFGNNPRQAMVYKNWHKKSESEKQEVLSRYNWLLENLDTL
ncbi:cryptochrome/photolyase family protein, partial [Psychrosphaera sp.]|nr:cryptochrome/photolyase family protein [Psychrosphaera sp.]